MTSDDEIAVVLADAAGIVREWNPAATALFGHRREDVVGHDLDVIVPEDFRTAHWARFHSVMAGAAPRLDGGCAHLPVLCADGEVRPFPGRFILLRSPAGEVVAAAATYGASQGAQVPFTPVATASETTAPTVRRVVANLPIDEPATDREFWAGLLGLEVAFDIGWVVNHRAADAPGVQVQLVSRDATAPEDSRVSVEVADVDAVHAEARRRGYEIVHPLTDEPWGVRRFFVRTPGGSVVNVLAHANDVPGG